MNFAYVCVKFFYYVILVKKVTNHMQDGHFVGTFLQSIYTKLNNFLNKLLSLQLSKLNTQYDFCLEEPHSTTRTAEI